ncbi:MAG: hypothetical protein N2690_00190 [Rhodocyclaceae bacterium]|nr:hypothetical protein [Rhodocyclaceae bacterium]
MRRRSLVVAAAVAALTPSYVGAGTGALATEITQIANNIELALQVSEAVQQTAQQINMLASMLHNLRDLSSLPKIAHALGLRVEGLESFIKTYNSVASAIKAVQSLETTLQRFGSNMSGLASFYGTLLEDLSKIAKGNGGLTRAQMHQMLGKMDSKKMEGARKVLAQRLDQIKEMQSDYQRIQDNFQAISDITGNVEGLQFMAAQNANIQRLLLDSNVAFQSYMAELQADRVLALEEKKRQDLEGAIRVLDAMRQARF